MSQIVSGNNTDVEIRAGTSSEKPVNYWQGSNKDIFHLYFTYILFKAIKFSGK